ncbi:MAG: alanine racemase, partial [Treponema sp.]|nr:alanine racemase [Treponema sp.]
RRFAQNGIKVAINGKAYPVRGRICMDQCMVDIGKDNKEIQRWDKAVIFGCKEDGALQTADDIAKLTGTISYEITTVLTRRVPREFRS